MRRSRFSDEQIIAIVKEQEARRSPWTSAAGTGSAMRLRDECLNETLFTSLSHARAVLAPWRDDHNAVRPHPQLGGRSPAQIAG